MGKINVTKTYLFLLVFLSSLGFVQTQLEPFTYGNYSLGVPPAWQLSDDTGALVMLQNSSSNTSPRIQVSIREYVAGLNADDFITDIFAQMPSPVTILQSYPSDTGEGKLVIAEMLDLSLKFAIVIDPDIHRNATVTGLLLAEVTTFDVLQAPALLTSITNSVAQVDTVPKATTAGNFSGRLYGCVVAQMTLGGIDLKNKFFVLFNDGTAFDGLPKGGLIDFSRSDLLALDPNAVGTYAEYPDRLELNFLNSSKPQRVLTKKGSKWSCTNGNGYELINPVPLRAGHFKSVKGSVIGPPFDNQVTFANTTDISFDGNGRFSWDSFVGISARARNPSSTNHANFNEATSIAENSKNGSYSLAGFTLTLIHDDGTVARYTAFMWDEGLLILNDKAYLKES